MIDPRGPRLGAWVTTLVLSVVLLTESSVLLAAQALVFVAGAAGHSPYGPIWKRLRRTLPTELEDARPVRFAQLVGLVFALVALTGFLTGVTALGLAATSLALVAAFLNAAFGLCLGCEMYLLIRRATTRMPTPTDGATA